MTSSKKSAKKSSKRAEIAFRLEAVLLRAENQVCADCPVKNPTWASLLITPNGSSVGNKKGVKNESKKKKNAHSKMGVFCCHKCCSYHYELGNEVCHVKNVKTPDEWTDEALRVMEASGNAVVNAIYEAGAIGYSKENVNPVAAEEEEARCNFVASKYKEREFLDATAFTAYIKEFDSLKIFSKKKTKNSGVVDSTNTKVKRSSSDPSLLLKLAVASTNEGQLNNSEAGLLGGTTGNMGKNNSFSAGLFGISDPAAAQVGTNLSCAKNRVPSQPEDLMSDRLSGFLNSVVPKRSEAQPVELGYDDATCISASTNSGTEEFGCGGPPGSQDDVARELARRSVSRMVRRGSLGGRGSVHGSEASLSSVGLDGRGSLHEKRRLVSRTGRRGSLGGRGSSHGSVASSSADLDSRGSTHEKRNLKTDTERLRRNRKSDGDLNLLGRPSTARRTRSGKSLDGTGGTKNLDEVAASRKGGMNRSKNSDGDLGGHLRASRCESGRKPRDSSVGSSSALSIGSVSSHGKNRRVAASRRTRRTTHQSRNTPNQDELGYGQPPSRQTSPASRIIRRGSMTNGRRSNEDLADMGVHARRARRRASLGGVAPVAPAEERDFVSSSHVASKRRQRRGSVGHP